MDMGHGLDGGHGGGHEGHDMPAMAKCSMHMLWNSQIVDTCVVFREWHISGVVTLLISCAVIAGLSVFYEYLRVLQKQFDHKVASKLVTRAKENTLTNAEHVVSREETELLTDPGTFKSASVSVFHVPFVKRIIRAAIYATTIALSFFLMLIFMTYNTYLIAAVVLGAGLGHFVFGGKMDTDAVLKGKSDDSRSMACH